MADEWISRTRPGAFQDPSFGTEDGWYAVIHFTMLFCTLANTVAVLVPVHDLEVGHGVGGGLNTFTAIGIAVYGFWIACFMSLKRWTIAVLPIVAWLVLLVDVAELIASVVPVEWILPRGERPISPAARIFAAVSAGLAVLALWRMRSQRFRAYNRAARTR